MNNVYRQIELFYEKRPNVEFVVPRAKVERYMREGAWHGRDEAELKQSWAALAAWLSLVDELHVSCCEALVPHDYQAAFYRYMDANKEEHACESSVGTLFNELEQFLKGYCGEDSEALERLRMARDSFHDGNGRFVPPERPEYDEICWAFSHLDELTPEQEDQFNDFLNDVLARLKQYFQAPQLNGDLQRAIGMFLGPIPQPDFDLNDAVWCNFWDFFLFDYHMLKDDQTPLRYYWHQEREHLTPGEKVIVQDLLAAQFIVFYINGVTDEAMHCTNLLTNEAFVLPCPDQLSAEIDKVLLIGHISSLRAILLQYLTTVTTTAKMRQRIKDELLLLYEVHRRYREPAATLADFFARHAGAMRHALMLCANAAQLRPTTIDEDEMPPVVPHYGQPLPHIEDFAMTAQRLGFGIHSVRMAGRLYGDFLAATDLAELNDVLPILFATALVLIEAFNGVEFASAALVAQAFRTTETAILQAGEIMADVLQCQALDPRYLTEEGCINSLYFQ